MMYNLLTLPGASSSKGTGKYEFDDSACRSLFKRHWQTWRGARQFSKTSFSFFIWCDIRLLYLQISFQNMLKHMTECSSIFWKIVFGVNFITLPADFFSRDIKTHDGILTNFLKQKLVFRVNFLPWGLPGGRGGPVGVADRLFDNV